MTFGKATPTARRLIQVRGAVCEVDGCLRLATEAHHCLFGRRKGKRHPVSEFDMDENLQLVCEECHAAKAKSHENKVSFWERQCERYGKEHMLEWLENLPPKIIRPYVYK